MSVQCYRCGYCGAPVSKDGEPLTVNEINKMESEGVDWDKAEQEHGLCCLESQNLERQGEYVTRDMALDAGDPSLEGSRC